MKQRIIFLCGICFCLLGDCGAQDSLGNHLLTLEAAFELALDNSVQLTIDARNLAEARQETAVERLKKLPSISSTLDYGYLSSADIWNPSFTLGNGLSSSLYLYYLYASSIRHFDRLAGLTDSSDALVTGQQSRGIISFSFEIRPFSPPPRK
jgi:hypothetical protein